VQHPNISTMYPSKVDGCSHKTAAIAARQLFQLATLEDLTTVKGRLDKIEATANP
jgi:hypothetical protein